MREEEDRGCWSATTGTATGPPGGAGGAPAAAGAPHGAALPPLRRAARRPRPGRHARADQGDRPLRPGARDRVLLIRGADDARRAQALLPRQRLGRARAARNAGARDAGRQRRQGPLAAQGPLAVGRGGRARGSASAPSRCWRRWRRRRIRRRLARGLSLGDEGDGETYAESIGVEDGRFELVEYGATIAPTLAALPARDRIVLHLRFVEDLTQAEIAERVGVSQMHVSRLIRRALERLRTVAEHSG